MREEQLLPAESILTPAGWESLRAPRPVVKSAQGDQPAVIAYARPFLTPVLVSGPQFPVPSEAPVSLLLEVLDENPQRLWSDDELLLIEQVTDQLTLALENARLHTETRQQLQMQVALRQSVAAINSSLELKDVLAQIAEQMLHAVNVTSVYISTVNFEAHNSTVVAECFSAEATEKEQTSDLGKTFEEPEGLLANILARGLWEYHVDDPGLDPILRQHLVSYDGKSIFYIPLFLRDKAWGYIELWETRQRRVFTPQEHALCLDIAQQASVAIEKASLFAESRRRAEELAILNEMSRQLSSQLEIEHIVQTIYNFTARLIDATNFYVALYEPEANEISFPLYIDEHQRVPRQSRQFGNGLTEYVIRARQPVLIKENVVKTLQEILGTSVIGREAHCWLGVPMIYAGQAIGVIAVQSYTTPNIFSENDRDLLSAIASQVAVAIVNARLFQQTQRALSALEVSEKYQKSVALSVAILTERGIAALSDVLRNLGEAANASRAYYFETQVDQRGAYWRLIAEWQAPSVPPQIDNPALRRISTRFLEPWLEQLRPTGYIAGPIKDMLETQREFFQPLGTRSVLQFAVPGRHEIPGCIGFEQIDHDRVWASDEIAALQTAASALANTLAREQLFTQVQINLAETEALYQASARLNTAASYDDILRVLRQHTVLGHVNASSLTLSLFDRPWTSTNQPEWLIPIARWWAKGGPSGLRTSAGNSSILGAGGESITSGDTSDRFSLAGWSTADLLLNPDRPSVVIDIATDPRIDEAGRAFGRYLSGGRETEDGGQAPVSSFEQARSLLFVPLNVAGRWIGHIIAIYRQTTGFPEQETRRLMSLAGQAAVAVESLRLLDETRHALAETENLYQASAELNAVQSYEDILQTLDNFTVLEQADNLLSLVLFDRPWISADSSLLGAGSERSLTEDRGMPEWAIPVAHRTLLPPEKLRPRYALRQFPAATLLSATQALIIEDVPNDPRLDESARKLYMDDLKGQSTIFVPLVVGGLWIGYINGVYSRPSRIAEADIRRMLALASQAAVAVQNLNSIQLAEQRAQEAQRRSEELSLINQIVSSVAGSLDLKASLDIVAEELGEALSGQVGVALLDETGETLTLIASYSSTLPATISGRSESASLPSPVGRGSASSFPTAQTIGTRLPVTDNPSIQEVVRTLRTLVSPSALLIPLIASNQFIGTIGVERGSAEASSAWEQSYTDSLEQARKFTADEIRLAETIVLQTSTAIQNARLFEQTQAVLEETEALYQASAGFQIVQNFDQILDALRTYTALGKDAFSVSIDLYDQPVSVGASGAELPASVRATCLARWGSPPPDTSSSARPKERGVSGAPLELDRYPLKSFPILSEYLKPNAILVVEDISQDPRLDEDTRKYYVDLFQARSTLFAPLIVGGQWIGHASALYPQPTHFTSDEIRRLMALVGQAAVAIQSLRLLDETRRRASQLQTAAEVARDTSTTLALDSLLNRVVNLLCQRFGYYHASVFLLDETETQAVIHESTGAAGEEMKRRGHRLDVGGRSVVGQTTLTGEPIVINDVNEQEGRRADSGHPRTAELVPGEGQEAVTKAQPIHRYNPLLPNTRAELGLPLKIGQRVIGALDVQADHTNAFSQDDIAVLQILADQVAVAVDNARSYELAQQAVKEIREADRLKTQFLANMSHELRTPLNSIIGFSRVILKGIDGPINDLQQQDLSAIYNSGQHLLGLINDVLDLSRIEAGKMELAFEEGVNLAEIINGVMSTTIGLVKDKPITLHKVIPPDLPRLRADPMKVRQVLLNLCSNAAKFTEQGSITVEASPQSDPQGQPEVIIKVTDTGHGIAPQDQVKLFQPFTQVDASLTRKTGGSGLGLSICHHLVRMHGGRIGLDSEVGKGSTFFFTLPLTGPTPATDELSADKEHPAELHQDSMAVQAFALGTPEAESSPGRNLSAPLTASSQSDEQTALLLAIDKDPQVIDLYKRFLAPYNFTVIALTELEQAATIARGLQPFAITLDISMVSKGGSKPPELRETEARLTEPAPRDEGSVRPPSSKLDGWKVLKTLKTEPETKNIPIIICSMLSEYEGQTASEHAIELGAAEYLLKPILEDDLVQAIRRLQETGSH